MARYWQGKIKERTEKPVPVPLCPPQSRTHTEDENQSLTSDVNGRRLTAVAMVHTLEVRKKQNTSTFLSNASRFPKKSTALCKTERKQETAQQKASSFTVHFPSACSSYALQPTRWLPHARRSGGGKWPKRHCFVQDWKDAGNCTTKSFTIYCSLPIRLLILRTTAHSVATPRTLEWRWQVTKNVVQIISLYY